MQPLTSSSLLIGFGTFFAVIFAVFLGLFQPLFNTVADNAMVLGEGKNIMTSYTSPPIPIYMNFYLFHVTNPRDVQYYGAKPILEEKGPYVYEEYRTKFNITFSEDGNTVLWYQNKTYFFREELSNGLKESDEITTLDLVIVLLAALEYDHKFINFLWPEIERAMNVFKTMTVAEMLYKGWELPKFNFDFSESGIPCLDRLKLNGTLADILREVGMADKVGPFLENNRIGYFMLFNDTNDGQYEVATGKADMSEYEYVRAWKGKPELSAWNDKYCDMINGTDGTGYPPRLLDEDSTIYIFVTQLCRSIYLTYDHKYDYYGVRALRFTSPMEVMENAYINPDNKCFCGSFGCIGSGMLELTSCTKIPIIMSLPHFYEGDGDELAKYEGLSPDKSKHQTFVDIEPTLGIPVSARKRIQFNLPLRHYGRLTSFMNFNLMYFPVLWGEEAADLTKADAKRLKNVLELPFIIVYSVGGVLLALSLIMLVVGLKKRSDVMKRQAI